MSSLAWYWHRLRAMTPAEWAGHFRRKSNQLSDSVFSAGRFTKAREIPQGSTFPKLPPPDQAPEVLRTALRDDAKDILAGRWIAFGQIELQVDDPPRWHKDYLTGTDLYTRQPAIKLNHRLQGKADNKLIWETSRWYSLVRLAQAAYVLRDPRAAATCQRWLEDWVAENQPYCGWNWTSALESGLRLVQFVWMDALLVGTLDGSSQAAWARLRAAVLAPHVWYTWRDRSFGSSANNHLIGELAGLILALVRWPGLARWAVPLETLQQQWESEVLKQFAADGGNREQALGYHGFSWEFCWQAQMALQAAGRNVSNQVRDRLRVAGSFYSALRIETDSWDYGDSDGAYVTPFFAVWRNAAQEWQAWLKDSAGSPSVQYWIGEGPKELPIPFLVDGAKGWRVYLESGMAVCRVDDWFLRWDLSPLGYLATASHGHCDALHLSIWLKGQPLIIDPGTGAYYSDRNLRDYLASWDAHNGPHPTVPGAPQRMGAFLWSAHHDRPHWEKRSDFSMAGELCLPKGMMRRTITRLEKEDGWQIDDGFYCADPGAFEETEVLWQLAPQVRLRAASDSSFRIETDQASAILRTDSGWSDVQHWCPAPGQEQTPSGQMQGLCSSAFRITQVAPFIRLRGRVEGSSVLRTTIIAERA